MLSYIGMALPGSDLPDLVLEWQCLVSCQLLTVRKLNDDTRQSEVCQALNYFLKLELGFTLPNL